MQEYVAIVERKTKPRKSGVAPEVKLEVVDLNTDDEQLAQRRIPGFGLVKEGQEVYLAKLVARVAIKPAEVVVEPLKVEVPF